MEKYLEVHNKLMALTDNKYMLKLVMEHVNNEGKICFDSIKQLTKILKKHIEKEEKHFG